MPGRLPVLLLVLAAYFGGRAWYFTPAVATTEVAADFTATLVDGRPFALRDLRGRYVLLEFWGSWCGPCRRESPELVTFARRFAARASLVSVAIERDSASWRRALVADGRNWPHQIMDPTTSLRFLSGPIADLYGVNRVPLHFLIAPDGRVVGADVSLAAAAQIITDDAR